MTAVDDAYLNFSILAESVSDKDLGALQFCNEVAAKTLLIAAAGDLERRFCDAMEQKFHETALQGHLKKFVSKRAINYQFHSLFDWKSNSVNSFLALFGDEKKVLLKAALSEEPYKQQVVDFLFIGRERNIIVHNGLASVSLDKTKDEIYSIYRNALAFVNFLQMNI